MTSNPSVSAAPGLDAGTRRGYALGSVATGTFATVPGLLLLPYLTDRLGVGAAAAAAIVFIPKAWDVVLNPIAGRISDGHASARGPRRPFLLRAGILLAMSFALLFAGPAAPEGLAATWVVVVFLACASAYAFFQVPYVAMPAEMTHDADERTRLMAWRVAVLALAILLGGASAPAIRDAVGPDQGYRVMGLVIAALILAGALGAYFGTARAPWGAVEASPGSLRDQLRVVATAPHFRNLLLTFVLQALATGAMLAGVDYVARYLLGNRAASTLLFLGFVAPAILVTGLWARVAARVGKKRAYLMASTALGLGAMSMVSASTAEAWVVYAAVALAGIGYAGAQMLPLSMLADCAAADSARTGQNRAGVFTGVWTAAETLGLALGPGLYGLVLAVGGYRSSTDGAASQDTAALSAISLGFSMVPSAVILLSFVFLSRYHLDASPARSRR